MNKEEYLKNMMNDKSGSVRAFANDAGIAPTTVWSVLNRGIDNARISTMIEIFKHLNLSLDEFLELDIGILQARFDMNQKRLISNYNDTNETGQQLLLDDSEKYKKIMPAKAPNEDYEELA